MEIVEFVTDGPRGDVQHQLLYCCCTLNMTCAVEKSMDKYRTIYSPRCDAMMMKSSRPHIIRRVIRIRVYDIYINILYI